MPLSRPLIRLVKCKFNGSTALVNGLGSVQLKSYYDIFEPPTRGAFIEYLTGSVAAYTALVLLK